MIKMTYFFVFKIIIFYLQKTHKPVASAGLLGEIVLY